MVVSRADNSVKIWWNLPISNPKPDIHNINAQFDENPLMFTQVIIRKRKKDGWTDGQTDRHTDVQHETIIPCHYCVAGYKNLNVQCGTNNLCCTMTYSTVADNSVSRLQRHWIHSLRAQDDLLLHFHITPKTFFSWHGSCTCTCIKISELLKGIFDNNSGMIFSSSP